MKIITNSREINFERVTDFYYVTTLESIGELAAKQADGECVLLYNNKTGISILFVLEAENDDN